MLDTNLRKILLILSKESKYESLRTKATKLLEQFDRHKSSGGMGDRVIINVKRGKDHVDA